MFNRYFQQNAKFFKTKKIYNCVYVKKQTDSSACKIVITTYLFLILAYWYNRLCKEYGKNKVFCYTAGMTNIKKADAK